MRRNNQVSDARRAGGGRTTAAEVDEKYAHVATPLHNHRGGSGGAKKTPRRAKSEGGGGADPAAYVAAVSCSDCRFKQRLHAPASPGPGRSSARCSCHSPDDPRRGRRRRRRRRPVGTEGRASSGAWPRPTSRGGARRRRARGTRRWRRPRG